jgi:hypothetical protein
LLLLLLLLLLLSVLWLMVLLLLVERRGWGWLLPLPAAVSTVRLLHAIAAATASTLRIGDLHSHALLTQLDAVQVLHGGVCGGECGVVLIRRETVALGALGFLIKHEVEVRHLPERLEHLQHLLLPQVVRQASQEDLAGALWHRPSAHPVGADLPA